MAPGRAVLLAILALPRVASGDGVATPRSVGRAGAAVVADDGAAAVVINPAALARREATRAQVGIAAVDDDARYQAGAGAPLVEDRGPARIAPAIGGAARLGPVVAAVVLVDAGGADRRFAAPVAGQPAADVEALYPHRYAGLAARHRRVTVGAGVSWRAGESLAIGASITATRVEVAEARRLWAGFAGRDVVGGAARDVDVAVTARDALVPGGAAGVLVAPIDVPIELAASVTWAAPARLDGEVVAAGATPGAAPTVVLGAPGAAATLASPLTIRTGARWLGERWIAELGGEVVAYPGAAAPRWRFEALSVRDESGVTAPVRTLPLQHRRRGHGAVRAAVDVEVVPGLVWLTGGWAWASGATPRERLAPAAADLGGHTIAAGAEIAAGGLTITLGLSRTFAPATTVDVSHLELDNPFAAGTAPTGLGRHDHARDVAALTIEHAWP